MSAVGRCSALTRDEAARVLQAAMTHSGWAGLVDGVVLVTGWRISEVTRRLHWLCQGATR